MSIGFVLEVEEFAWLFGPLRGSPRSLEFSSIDELALSEANFTLSSLDAIPLPEEDKRGQSKFN